MNRAVHRCLTLALFMASTSCAWAGVEVIRMEPLCGSDWTFAIGEEQYRRMDIAYPESMRTPQILSPETFHFARYVLRSVEVMSRIEERPMNPLPLIMAHVPDHLWIGPKIFKFPAPHNPAAVLIKLGPPESNADSPRTMSIDRKTAKELRTAMRTSRDAFSAALEIFDGGRPRTDNQAARANIPLAWDYDDDSHMQARAMAAKWSLRAAAEEYSELEARIRTVYEERGMSDLLPTPLNEPARRNQVQVFLNELVVLREHLTQLSSRFAILPHLSFLVSQAGGSRRWSFPYEAARQVLSPEELVVFDMFVQEFADDRSVFNTLEFMLRDLGEADHQRLLSMLADPGSHDMIFQILSALPPLPHHPERN